MKKILVALDNSFLAPHVLRQAAAFAQAFGGELVLVRALGLPVELPPEAFTMNTDGVTELLRSIADKEIHQLAATLPPEVPRSFEVRPGAPWQVVCEIAEERDVDLIVIGAHGHKAVLDRLLGTTTARVASHTERSTLIVRAPRVSLTDKA